MIFSLSLLTLGAAAFGLRAWRRLDHRADRTEMDRLLATQPSSPDRFDVSQVAHLPHPARRFFEFAIQPGTPLRTVAEIDMTGRFGMGTKEAPNYVDMQATQVLAAPTGFVWKMSAGRGVLRMSGSDSAAWTRFWLLGLVPVARLGGSPDHRRSAFGRYVAEAVFWTPAAILPGPGISWEALDEDTARLTVVHGDLEQSVDVTVDSEGRSVRVEFLRWTNANPEKTYRLQPFGGDLSEHREFQGFRVPTHVEAGNQFGTAAYFPFFVADVSSVRYPARTCLLL